MIGLLVSISALPTRGDAQNLVEDGRTSISIINLIATPERFHNREVIVAGWISLKFEDMSLCLAERVPSAKECVWLNIEESTPEQQEQLKAWERYNGQLVVVEGRFDQDDLGHFGEWAGGIGDVVRISPLGRRGDRSR